MNPTTGRLETVLGFDFGMRRIGIAVGQTMTKTAQPLSTLMAKKGVPQWYEVDAILKIWQPDALIVGVPLNMNGTIQEITLKAQAFQAQLAERYSLPTLSMDERLSSVTARAELFNAGGYQKLKAPIDSVAAQLILEHWLQEYNA